jgi:argonaute family protein
MPLLHLVCQIESSSQDLILHEYQCDFRQNPDQGDEQRALSSICDKVGVTAISLAAQAFL